MAITRSRDKPVVTQAAEAATQRKPTQARRLPITDPSTAKIVTSASAPASTKPPKIPRKPTAKPPAPTLLIHFFPTPVSFISFLASHYSTLPGIHLKIAKKATGIPSVTWPEAVEVALCFGWIDGRRDKFDESYFLQRFTPRRTGSLWSRRNVESVERLIGERAMRESGMRRVEEARGNGRWENCYGRGWTGVKGGSGGDEADD